LLEELWHRIPGGSNTLTVTAVKPNLTVP
jgi:hypothetical protein